MPKMYKGVYMKNLIVLFLLVAVFGCSSSTKTPKPPEVPPTVVVPEEKPEEKPIPKEEPKQEEISHWKPSAIGFMPQCMHLSGTEHLDKYLNKHTNVLVLELSQVEMYRKEIVPYIKERNIKLQCYFSASYEEWRGDERFFPEDAKGKKMDGWDELWGDFTKVSLQKFLGKRMDRAKRYGCDGIEIDNTDIAFNDVGFDVTKKENIASLKILAKMAHDRGLGIFLKNSGAMASRLHKHFDGVNNESCQRYNECDDFQTFVDRKKPVYEIEYRKRECNPFLGHHVQYKSGYFSKTYKDCN